MRCGAAFGLQAVASCGDVMVRVSSLGLVASARVTAERAALVIVFVEYPLNMAT